MLSSFVSAISISAGLLIFCRILQGIASAMCFSANTAILADKSPPRRRGKALGICAAASCVGLIAGPLAGGLMNDFFGWRSIFIVSSIFALAAFLAVFLKMREDPKESNAPETKNPPFDIPGSIYYIFSISLIICGIALWASQIWTLVFIPAGFILLLFLVRRELHGGSPLLGIRLLVKDKNFAYSNLAALFNCCWTSGIVYFVSIYLQLVKEYDSFIAALIMIGQPIVQAIVSPYAGSLSDKAPPFKVAGAGMALCAAGLLAFCFIGAQTPLPYIIISLIALGCGFGLFSAPNANAILSRVSRENFDSANSFLATMRNFGQSASMAIVGGIMAARIGSGPLSEAIPQDIIFSMRTGCVIFAALCVIGIFLAIRGRDS